MGQTMAIERGSLPQGYLDSIGLGSPEAFEIHANQQQANELSDINDHNVDSHSRGGLRAAAAAFVITGIVTPSLVDTPESPALVAETTGLANTELDLAAAQVIIPSSDRLSYSVATQAEGDGIDDGIEDASHVAVEGSCSSITNEQVRHVTSGQEAAPTKDLKVVEQEFLSQNREFAANKAKTSEQQIGSLYDVLDIKRPSQHEKGADQAMIDVFSDSEYRTAPIKEDQVIINTYCDVQGNVHFYRATVLEAGTFVGGTALQSYEVQANGTRVAVTKDGREVIMDRTTIVANVEIDGKIVPFVAAFKSGIDTDGDGEAEMGCDNIIYLQPPTEKPPVDTTVPPTVPKEDTTVPPDSSTSSSTDTTVPPDSSTSSSTSTTFVNPKPPQSSSSTTVPPVTDTTEKPQPSLSLTTTTTNPNTTTTNAGNTTTSLLPPGECGISCEEITPNTYFINTGTETFVTTTTEK